MTEREMVGRVGALEIARWRDRALPAGLAALIDEASADGIGWIDDFLGEWEARPLLDAGEALFLAFEGGTPKAMAVISADPHIADPEVGRLRYIYVAKDTRGLGLLRIFVDACLARGAGRWRRLRLHTDNPQAARVYESYGFRAVTDEARSTHVRPLQPPVAAAASET